MGILSQFSTTSQTGFIGKMTENVNNKIPVYAREYKREYQFIRGINKDFKYLINKINDKLNNGLNEFKLVDRIKYSIMEKGFVFDYRLLI